MKILITGGTGYLGSHTSAHLVAQGHDVLVVDDLSNSTAAVVSEIALAAGREAGFEAVDVRCRDLLEPILRRYRPDVVLHFAGYKAVRESISDPLLYYDNNVAGTISLLKSMEAADCRRIVFSSSAIVYGEPKYLPIDEAHPIGPTNPYGRTKAQIETILQDLCAARPDWSAVVLRYFNPAGAHQSGWLGERPNGVPNNLFPYLAQVADGTRTHLEVFGNDYDTSDGTPVRDYIHVDDLASAHSMAVELACSTTGVEILNLGVGQGFTVLQVIRAFEEVIGRPIPYEVSPRRPGDVGVSYASASKAHTILGWEPRYGLADMCRSMWAFQTRAVKTAPATVMESTGQVTKKPREQSGSRPPRRR